MTVGIGAICEGGKSAVVAADKMVTFGAPMNLQTEPSALRKITELSERVLVVFSGGTSDGAEIVALCKPKILINPRQPVPEIAQTIRDAYGDHKQRKVEETILRPYLGTDFKGFQTLLTQTQTSQPIQQILGLVGQHNLQTEFLVVGMDDTGAHLFAVTHPGQIINLETTGFACIGSGGLHAGVRMAAGQHTSTATLVDTLYNVYEAKRASEVAPGVGKLTDLAIIQNGKITVVNPKLLKALEHSHKEKPALSHDEHEKLKEACHECIEQSATPPTKQ